MAELKGKEEVIVKLQQTRNSLINENETLNYNLRDTKGRLMELNAKNQELEDRLKLQTAASQN